MVRKILTITGLMAVAASTMLADFSYQETTRLTGGAIVGLMKVAGVFSKQARQANEPIQSTVAIQGDRMVRRNSLNVTVIDLGSQTITNIDLQKKTYTVMTFEQMKQAMEQATEKMQQNKDKDKAEMTFKVSANSTGRTKQIAGFDAREMVLTMDMQGTDKQTGQTGGMTVIADTWIAPKVPGYDEVRNFQRRMAEKLNWTPGGNMFMNRPDMVEGMSEVYKESAKMDGMPVFQTTTMGAQGTAPVDRSDQPAGAQQQSSDKPSVGSALGGALKGRFGLGGKKSQPQQDTQQPPPDQGGQANASGVLMEMTTEMTGFSASLVDGSQFEVPAGFKKVEPDPRRGVK